MHSTNTYQPSRRPTMSALVHAYEVPQQPAFTLSPLAPTSFSSFPLLPRELQLIVASHLSVWDLFSLCRCNRSLHSLLLFPLFQRALDLFQRALRLILVHHSATMLDATLHFISTIHNVELLAYLAEKCAQQNQAETGAQGMRAIGGDASDRTSSIRNN